MAKAKKKAEEKKVVTQYKITKDSGRVIFRNDVADSVKKTYENKGWKVEAV